MLQYFIVIFIVLSAVIYTVYQLIHSLSNKNKSLCDGCDGCDIKNEILKNQKKGTKALKSCDSYHPNIKTG
jgi:hypothetical protein